MSGLMYAITEPPPGEEPFYHRWYDEEHIPDRINVGGFVNAVRYICLPGDGRYVTLYDLANPDVIRLNAYRQVLSTRTAEEAELLERMPFVTRRIYAAIGDPVQAATRHAPYVLVTGLTPADGAESEVLAWHDAEFVPLLERVPGVRRIRRFEQVEGDGPRFAVIVDLDSLAPLDGPELASIRSTRWFVRLHEMASATEWSAIGLLRAFSARRWVVDGVLGPDPA
jgi:hypothetical protein